MNKNDIKKAIRLTALSSEKERQFSRISGEPISSIKLMMLENQIKKK